MAKQIPITLITGFLGSGKSTLINKILKEKSNTQFGLIVNEFGDIPIETQVIEANGDEIIELAQGCMCCVVKKDLLSTVEKLLKMKPAIQHILLEASGLSDPVPIASTFLNDDLNGRLRFDTIICVVDGKNFFDNYNQYQITAKQIEFADFVVLSKIQDLNPDQKKRLQDFFEPLTRQKTIMEWTNELALELLLDLSQSGYGDIKLLKTAHQHHAHEHVDTLFFKSAKSLEVNKLGEVMNSLPQGVVRAKGFLKFKAQESVSEEKFILQYVGGRFTLETKSWKRGEKKESALIFIGKDFDRQQLYSALKACEEA